jgi:hypothetical protein
MVGTACGAMLGVLILLIYVELADASMLDEVEICEELDMEELKDDAGVVDTPDKAELIVTSIVEDWATVVRLEEDFEVDVEITIGTTIAGVERLYR